MRKMTNAELKAQAKQMLSGNWGTAIIVLIVTSILLGVGNTFGISLGSKSDSSFMQYKLNIVQFVIGGAVSVGIAGVYLSFLRQGKAEFVRMFDGFSDCFVASLIANIINSIAVSLGCVLLIVPGIIISLMFSQAFYILRDHPDMSGIDALMASKDMMYGHKMDLFKLWLSFIPWFLLCVLVIPALYVIPYFTASITAFYENVKMENNF